MRKLLLGSLLVFILGLALYLRLHHKAEPIEPGYAANGQVSIWSTAAPVRDLVATANYGDRLDVLSRSGDSAQVRTTSGATGWVSQADLISADSWTEAQALLSQTDAMPTVALGKTRVLGNLHLSPLRSAARIWQLNRGIPLDLFERQAVAMSVPAATKEPLERESEPARDASDDVRSDEPQLGAKKEDWWLVRAKVPNHGDVAGWILGRFIDLDLPAPLGDYADSARMRVVAWFELNDVPDGVGRTKPQYLVVGARGPEGQPCDFTMMRAYTWSRKLQQYETAFTESDACGKLPVQLKRDVGSGGGLHFSFVDSSSGEAGTRTYVMRDTMIRRVHDNRAPTKRRTRGR